MARQNVLLHNSDDICALDLDRQRIAGRQSVDILARDVYLILRISTILAERAAAPPISILSGGPGSDNRRPS